MIQTWIHTKTAVFNSFIDNRHYMIMAMSDLFFGLLGFVLTGIAYVILGKRDVTKKQKAVLVLLGLLAFSMYLIWGLFNFSLEVGSELDVGGFQISYGISESMMWLLILILPLILSVLLVILLQRCNWIKRYLIPILLFLGIVGLNFYQIDRYYQKHALDFERPYYSNTCLRGENPNICYLPN